MIKVSTSEVINYTLIILFYDVRGSKKKMATMPLCNSSCNRCRILVPPPCNTGVASSILGEAKLHRDN